MKQYKITSDDLSKDSPDDCVLPPGDVAHEIKRLQYLGGLGGRARLQEYRTQTISQSSNISVTAAENVRIQKEQNIRPGTPEWFQLWFSLPYLTGEKKFGK